MILDSAIIKSVLGEGRVDHRGNLYVKCLWCGHDEFSISLFKNNHPFNCLRKKMCGETGTLYKILKKLDRLDILRGQGVKLLNYDQKLEDIITKKLETEELDLDVPTIEPPVGWKRIYSNYYLENRGFEMFDSVEVGTTKLLRKFKDRVIFLVRENNEIKGYLSRLTKTSDEQTEMEAKLGYKLPRYLNSKTEFGKLLDGIDEINEYTEEVMLVEGKLSKEGVDRNLKTTQNSPIKCCCTFGAKLSKEQIFKLQIRGIKKIILFFELDVINKIKKHSLELLNEFESVKIIVSNFKNEKGKYKDGADLNEQEMQHVIENHTDPINFYLKKVQILNLK